MMFQGAAVPGLSAVPQGTARLRLLPRARAQTCHTGPSVSQFSSASRTCHGRQRVRRQHQAPRRTPSRTPCPAVPLPEVVTSSLFAASTLYTVALGMLVRAALPGFVLQPLSPAETLAARRCKLQRAKLVPTFPLRITA
jgi:hypothetical protein